MCFDLNFASYDQVTTSWLKLKKCGVLGSAFFFSTSCAEISSGENELRDTDFRTELRWDSISHEDHNEVPFLFQEECDRLKLMNLDWPTPRAHRLFGR